MKSKYEKTFLIILFLLSTKVLTAQISIGIQGGLNSAILKLSNKAPEATLYYRDGFILGSIINYNLDEIFSIRSEPRYIQKGERAKLDLQFYKTDNKIYFNYFEVPVYFVAEFTKSQLKPFVLAGINLGYLINSKAVSLINDEETTIDIKDEYKKLDIATDLGIGIKYEIDITTSLLFNGRYSFGVFDITDREGTVNTRGIQILFGILYKL